MFKGKLHHTVRKPGELALQITLKNDEKGLDFYTSLHVMTPNNDITALSLYCLRALTTGPTETNNKMTEALTFALKIFVFL